MPHLYQYMLFILLMIFFLIPEVTQAQDQNPEMSIRIDSSDAVPLNVRTALLYRNVRVLVDSTLVIQNAEEVSIKYYPQIEEGKQNVLRILAGEIGEEKTDFYDIFIVVGDTVPDTLVWEDEKSRVFLTHNGYIRNNIVSSSDINGQISFDRDNKNKLESVAVSLNFLYPLFRQPPENNRIVLKGQFKLRVGEFREINLSQLESDKEKSQKSRQNLYLGIVFSAFLIAIFGLL